MPRANIWDPRFTRLQQQDAGFIPFGPSEAHWDDIIHAALTKNTSRIIELRDTLSKENLDARGFNSTPPLILSAQLGDHESVKALLKLEGPDGEAFPAAPGLFHDTVDCEDRTALVWAAKEGHIAVMKEFWKLHPDALESLIIREDNYKENALSYAARKGHTEAVRMILDATKELDIINTGIGDPRESSALIDAVHKGHLEIVRLLLSHPRIRPNEKYGPHGEEKKTALEVAEAIGASEAIKTALRKEQID